MELPPVKPGDIVAFRGRSPLSRLIELYSYYSHVGVVLSANPPQLIESTTDISLPDDRRKELIKGVQIHDLATRVTNYDGGAWLCALKTPLADEAIQAMRTFLENQYAGRVGYDYLDVMGLGVELVTKFNLHNQPDFSKVFCSELATMALQHAGLINQEFEPLKQTPEMVTRFDCLEAPVCLKTEFLTLEESKRFLIHPLPPRV